MNPVNFMTCQDAAKQQQPMEDKTFHLLVCVCLTLTFTSDHLVINSSITISPLKQPPSLVV